MKLVYKRITAVIICVLLLLSAVGCESSNTPVIGSTDIASQYEKPTNTDIVDSASDTSTKNNSSKKKNSKTDSDDDKPFVIPDGSDPFASLPSRCIYCDTERVPDANGETYKIMREWDPYPNGKCAAWDNFNNWVKKTEKWLNVKIVEKKWKFTLAAEMLAGIKPEGHLYLVGPTGGNIYDFAAKGYITPLDDAMKHTGINMKEEIYNIYNTQASNIGGKQWSIAFGFARVNSAVYYRKDLIEAEGYDIQKLIDDKKWNWSKMTEIAKKLTVADSSGEITNRGIALGENGIKGMILSNGGNIVSPNSNGKFVSHLKDANTTQAIKQVYNWYHTDKVANLYSNDNWKEAVSSFINGKAAMLFVSDDDADEIYSALNADAYGVAYLPMGPKSSKYVSHIGSNYSYVIPSVYSNIAPMLLCIADELHQWPVGGYTRDDQFRDEWSKSFHSAAQYKMWYNMHYSDNIEIVWEASDNINYNSESIESIIRSADNSSDLINTVSSKFSSYLTKNTSKYKYTGSLK